jgi:hypothetical protein
MDFQRFSTTVLTALLVGGFAAQSSLTAAEPAPASEPPTIDFIRDVQPILIARCYECHGPDRQEADLRFDRRPSKHLPAARVKLDSDAPNSDAPDGADSLVVPGDPQASLLLQRVTADDPDERMPPEGAPLDAQQLAVLTRWISEGGSWPEDARHWAFVPPVRPPLPSVADRDWPRNAIDFFIAARLEHEGLRPSPEADRIALIRRLSLDLTGLPPIPEDVDRFLSDPSPDAYEQLVERLLDSPHYGERWAVRWLDLARYGDTDGYDYDRVRPMWLYRDWVIDALNTDMPFDRFVVEQLAGDLLPEATPEQHMATGFIRNSPVPQYKFDTLIDRVAAVGTAFLGLSLECAQCHNHKFDPISQREFYQLYSLFKNTGDREIEARSPVTGATAKTLVAVRPKSMQPAYIKIGGSFLNKGDRVEPGAIEGLHPLPERGVPDRLALAEWLTDRENPLLARVAVNRQWEAFFGRGLVPTSEDLGTRTERPSHPELLDWLAVEFMDRGWSLKHIHRLIVTSAVYRQSSRVTPELLRHDPTNRWLARSPRLRVDAEFVRDITLAASGMLDRRIGGPSVFPPQPYGITENRERGAYKWQESDGADRRRRGLYTFWKRAALHPSLVLFDAPRRETSCARRIRSTTPLQALVTLNDPAFVEAAVVLGRRMVEVETADPDRQIAEGFRRCLSRRPTDAELAHLREFYEAEVRRFERTPQAARDLIGDKSADDAIAWAACSMLAGVLLNLDETITKP